MNSIQAMKEAMKLGQIPSEGVKTLLVALAQDVRPGNGFDVWPGLETLAGRMGVKRRTAERRKAAAIKAGLISATPRQRSEGRGRTSDLIHLDFLDDKPDNGCRIGQSTTNPTDWYDQPDSPTTTNPTTGVGGLEKEESKELEQEEDDSFAVAQTTRANTPRVSAEQGDFLGQVGRGDEGVTPNLPSFAEVEASLTAVSYEQNPSPPESPPSRRSLYDLSEEELVAIAEERLAALNDDAERVNLRSGKVGA